jgi:C4-dicarboxylate transporter DctM subunit
MLGMVFAIMLGLLLLGVPVAFSILSSGIVFLLVTNEKTDHPHCPASHHRLGFLPLAGSPPFHRGRQPDG